jgi:hypothetical protein
MTPPTALIEALKGGWITKEQLRELIRCEADELGMTYEQAEDLAQRRQLPKGPLGTDIEYLFDMLAAA